MINEKYVYGENANKAVLYCRFSSEKPAGGVHRRPAEEVPLIRQEERNRGHL